MNIRRATVEDCPAMLELIRELAVYEKAPYEVTVDPKHFEESGFGENPVWWAFVAEAETKDIRHKIQDERIMTQEFDNASPYVSHLTSPISIVAFALYYIRYSTWKGQVMYLEDLLVTESMRGNGIGKLLLDRLIEEARQKGFKKVVWQVLDWNEPAINFYKKYNASFDGGWVNVSVEV